MGMGPRRKSPDMRNKGPHAGDFRENKQSGPGMPGSEKQHKQKGPKYDGPNYEQKDKKVKPFGGK